MKPSCQRVVDERRRVYGDVVGEKVEDALTPDSRRSLGSDGLSIAVDDRSLDDAALRAIRSKIRRKKAETTIK